MSIQRPDHIAEADWEAMSPRAKKRAVRPEQPAQPKPTPEQKAASEFSMKLIDNGGNYWVSQDGSKKRIYINEMAVGNAFETVYWDCLRERWSNEALGKIALAKMESGIRFNA